MRLHGAYYLKTSLVFLTNFGYTLERICFNFVVDSNDRVACIRLASLVSLGRVVSFDFLLEKWLGFALKRGGTNPGHHFPIQNRLATSPS